MNNQDEIARNSREYLNQARREREGRGLPGEFLDPAKAPYDLAALKDRAEKLGREEGPLFLTQKQTAAGKEKRARMNPEKFPDQCKWLDDFLRRFGTAETGPTD